MKKNCFRILVQLIIIFGIISCTREFEFTNNPNLDPYYQINHPLPSKGLMALTYDDGPAVNTFEIAKYLDSVHISATFFVVCGNESGDYNMYNNYLDSLIVHGQRIGNHTFTHMRLTDTSISCEVKINNIETNQQIIDSAILNSICYFRCPWGDYLSSDYDSYEQCFKTCTTLDKLHGPIYWTHDYYTRDVIKDNNVDDCVNDFFSRNASHLNNLESGIILMHDSQSFSLEETKRIIPHLKDMGYIFVAPTLEFSPRVDGLCETTNNFSDNEGWASHVGYYGTIRLADVNGDRKADIVARKSDGIYVSLSAVNEINNKQYFESEVQWSADFSDEAGWLPAMYSTTIQCADVNGDHNADLVIRGAGGIYVALSNGSAFNSMVLWSDFCSDANGWYDIRFYGTIRIADVNGDGNADLICRDSTGILVCKADPESSRFCLPDIWSYDFVDYRNWLPEQFGTTIQFADVNDDDKADLVIRGKNGIYVALSTGNRFKSKILWLYINSNSHVWNQNTVYWSNIRLGDVNGDRKADLIATFNDGISVSLSSGTAFVYCHIWTDKDFIDPKGYLQACYNTTLQCGDINGDKRADFIIRSDEGIVGSYAP